MEPSKEQLQLTFDKVAKHLLKQGRRAMADKGLLCVYKAKDGAKCAVGCLIPSRSYASGMEGMKYRDLIVKYPELRDVPEIDHCDDLLMALQNIHDTHEPKDWMFALRELAVLHEIDAAVLGA